MKAIASRDNATFKRLRAIASDARARKTEHRIWLEGEHLVRAWLDASQPIETVAVDDRVASDPLVAACVARAQGAGAERVDLTPSLMRTLSSLDSPAPIAAIASPIVSTLDALRGLDAITLDAVQDPGNVGALLRTAVAAGVSGVVLGPGCASAWAPKVLRAAMGAHTAISIVEVDTLDNALGQLGVPLLGTVVDAEAQDLYALDLSKPVAWVFGHEGRGLSPELTARLDRRVYVPQAAGVESLNVAAAAAVCLFEMRRQRRT